MVTLGQLLSRRELGLDVLVDPPGSRAQEVTIVHSSELPTVDSWLGGGEVLLTIGASQDLAGPEAEDYIARLAAVGVRALGIGLGAELSHEVIPPSLITHAAAHGLTLFGVPEPVPFVAVVAAFTRMREEETNRELGRASRSGRRFATALHRHGPAGLVTELAAALGASAELVSPTGRGLGAGPSAPQAVRLQLIAARGTSNAPRLLRAEEGMVEAVPIGDDRVRGWILTPAEAAGARTRSLLLSTAAALLGLTLAEDPPRREESSLFHTSLEVAAARAEWVRATGTASVPRLRLRVLDGIRGPAAEQAVTDLGADVLVSGAGGLLAVLHPDEPSMSGLVTRIAEVEGLHELLSRTLAPGQVHHVWTVWRSQPAGADAEVRDLLSTIEEARAAEFVDRVLGPVLAAPGGHELLATLRAFVAASGVRDRVAAELGIHRHTVRARLSRIETLLGRSLTEAGTVQAVALALALTEVEVP